MCFCTVLCHKINFKMTYYITTSVKKCFTRFYTKQQELNGPLLSAHVAKTEFIPSNLVRKLYNREAPYWCVFVI